MRAGIRNLTASFTMVFGYMNRNDDERPEIPVGPNNSFTASIRGRPHTADGFLPAAAAIRRRSPACRRPLGSSSRRGRLTRAGKTEKAVGKLDRKWNISAVVDDQTPSLRPWRTTPSWSAVEQPLMISVDGPSKLTRGRRQAAGACRQRQRRRRHWYCRSPIRSRGRVGGGGGGAAASACHGPAVVAGSEGMIIRAEP